MIETETIEERDTIIISHKKKSTSSSFKEAVAGYIFILPALAGLLIFTIGPMIASFVLSLTKFSGFTTPTFIGVQNYIDLFTNDTLLFKKSITVTLYYAFFNIIVTMSFSLCVALLLNRNFRGKVLLRAIFFLPSILPLIATSILIRWMFNPEFGLINSVLRMLNLPTSQWFFDSSSVITSFILMSVWLTGGTIVIFLATLQDVPVDLINAVEIDGGNAWHKFRHVTIPFISPVLLFQSIIGIIGSFQIFAQVFVVTQGGPSNNSNFITYKVYNDVFQFGRYGLGCAEAWVLFAIIVFLSLVVFRSSKFWVFSEGGDNK